MIATLQLFRCFTNNWVLLITSIHFDSRCNERTNYLSGAKVRSIDDDENGHLYAFRRDPYSSWGLAKMIIFHRFLALFANSVIC